jgi:hypothetical protein
VGAAWEAGELSDDSAEGRQRPRAGEVAPALLKALARGRRWFEEMASSGVRSCAEIARREG